MRHGRSHGRNDKELIPSVQRRGPGNIDDEVNGSYKKGSST